MSFEIKFTKEAEETYDLISNQLRKRWGNSLVGKLENKVSKCLSIIQDTPFIYPMIDEQTEIRKCVIHKNCSLLYRVIDTTVVIICFWDNRQEPMF